MGCYDVSGKKLRGIFQVVFGQTPSDYRKSPVPARFAPSTSRETSSPASFVKTGVDETLRETTEARIVALDEEVREPARALAQGLYQRGTALAPATGETPTPS